MNLVNETLFLREELAALWQGHDPFDMAKNLVGEIFRDKEGRRTLRFEMNGHSYFLKWHNGVGWTEIIKNLLQLRLPIVSAENEWQAIQHLHAHGIDSMTIAGYGQRGKNPASRQSFLITDELTNTMSLEHLGRQWQQRPPSLATKRLLIKKLAQIARTMHESGLNHRDFYLCHFLLDKSFAETNEITEDTRLYLIDLHRAQIHNVVPLRWRVKDIGSLYFSAMEVPLSQRDLFRFIKHYSNCSLKDALNGSQARLWGQVKHRADALLTKWNRQQAQ